MRNVFDQYSQPENRLTHALIVGLAEDPRLLRSFLKEVAGVQVPRISQLAIGEQSLPGERSPSEEEAERRGLPDGWIHDGESWAVLIETKLTARLTADQIRRHIRTVQRRGIDEAIVLALTARSERIRLPANAHLVSWRSVYSWLVQQRGRSEWAGRVAEYLEIVEARMSEREESFEGSLTEFTGFPFGPGSSWSYGEAKRVLRLATEELRKRRIFNERSGWIRGLQGEKRSRAGTRAPSGTTYR